MKKRAFDSGLFSNFLITSLRNLYQHKLYTLISITGLSVGIACFTVLFLLIRHEISYDQSHPFAEKTYRIIELINRNDVGEKSASLPFPVAPTLVEKYPQIVRYAVRLFNFQSPHLPISFGEKKFNEKKFFFADKDFFHVFNFPLAQGDPNTALTNPNTVVISAHIAQKYFGNEDPMGKILVLRGKTMLRVTGVFEKNQQPSHISADFVASFATLEKIYQPKTLAGWVWNPCWTYVVLTPTATAQSLHSIFPSFVNTYFDKDLKDYVFLDLQAVDDIHLHSQLDYEISANSDIYYIYIFGAMSVFVLIIASINFMNLASARILLRAKEVIVRKVIGASQLEIIGQFVAESLFLSILAIIDAFILVELISPYLSDLSGKPLTENILNGNTILIGIISSGLLVGLLSGIYPAYQTLSLVPANVLKGNFMLGRNKLLFRRILVFIQFGITGFMLISMFVSHEQYTSLKNAKLGFEKEQIVIIPIANTPLMRNYDNVKAWLLRSQNIEAVTGMETILGKEHQTHEYKYEQDKSYTFYPSMIVEEDFIKTFAIKVIAKQKENQIDLTCCQATYEPILINQSMAVYLGFQNPQKAIGKLFQSMSSSKKIVGVVEDFHFSSLREPITAFVISVDTSHKLTKYIAFRSCKYGLDEAIVHAENVWKAFNPQQPFEYFFLRDDLEKMYIREKKLTQFSIYFALIALVIASMGLYGLTAFVLDKRRKEIGIRKAMGASYLDLIYLFSKEFIALVSLSSLVASLFGYWAMKQWLESFPYHIALSWQVFVFPFAIILAITMLTVGIYSFKTVLNTPTSYINRT